MTEAVRLNILLKIAGVETRCHRAEISGGESMFETAMVSLPPTEHAAHFVRGSRIEIYSRTPFYTGTGDEWRLEFVGELTGRGVNKGHGTRSVTLVATGHGHWWTRIRKYHYNIMDPEFAISVNQPLPGESSTNVIGTDFLSKVLEKHGSDISRAIADVLTHEETGTRYGIDGKTESRGNVTNTTAELAKAHYEGALGTLGLQTRLLMAITSSNVKQAVITKSIMELVAGGRAQAFDGITSLMDYATTLMSYVNYNFTSIAAGSLDKNGKLMTYICKPRGELMPPPKCNVVFPNQIVSMTFREDFLQEPTRIISTGAGSLAYISHKLPTWLQEGIAVPARLNTTGTFKEFLIAEGHKPSEYEKIYGTNIHLVEQAMYLSLLKENQDDYIKALNHEFFKRFYASRTFTAIVDPYVNLVPGFPAVLLDATDSRNHIVAYCTQLRRVFSASGGADTVATFEYPRFYGELDTIYNNSIDPLDTDAENHSKLYDGIGSVAIADSSAKVATKIDALLREYLNNERDPMVFAESYTKRANRCTPEQIVATAGIGQIAQVTSRNGYRIGDGNGEVTQTMPASPAAIVEEHNKVLQLTALRG